MREDLVAFLKRAAETGDIVIDLCDTGIQAGIVRSFEPAEVAAVEICADTILDSAKSDAVGRNGKIRYEVTGVRDGKRWGRHPIVIDTGIGNAGTFGVEDANLQGIVVELIRDKRLMTTVMVGQADNMMTRMQAMLDLQAKERLEVENQRIKIFEILEDLSQHKHERDITARRVEVEARASDRMVEGFMPMVPMIANKLLGKATGETLPLGGEMIGSLLASLDEKQIQAIMSTLDPMQAAAFISFMQETAKLKEETEAKEKREYEARQNGTAPNSTGGIG